MGKPFTPKEDEIILAGKKAGYNFVEIGNMLDRRRSTVSARYALLVGPGIKRPPSAKTLEPHRRINNKANEPRYVQMRREGYTASAASEAMGLTLRQTRNYENAYRTETYASNASAWDQTTPKFGDDDLHLSKLARFGGFDRVARLMMRQATRRAA